MTNHTQANSNSGRSPISTNRTKFRSLLALALLFMGVSGMKAQTYYVFYNSSNGYIYNNGSNGAVKTTFTKSCIWAANDALSTTSNYSLRNIKSYTADKYMNGSNNSFTLGNSSSTWRIYYNYLTSRTNSSYYYVKLSNSNLTCATGNSGTRFSAASFTISTETAVNPTINISATAGLSGGGIQLTANVSGTYTPDYSYASVHNYNNNSSTTYYWTATTEASTEKPSSITTWDDATYSWAVTTGGTYARVSDKGLVTITGNPTGNITVTLTVSKGGYTGTQTFTLTRATINQNVSTETAITGPTITPTSAALYYNQFADFTASATATKTTRTIPAHTTLTGGGQTFYYYQGTLYSSTDDFKTDATSDVNVTYAWALDANSYITRDNQSGNTTRVTHSTQAQSDGSVTLTVTATATGASSKTATATITAYGPMVPPTITRSGNTISITPSNVGTSIYYTTDGTTPSSSSTPYTGSFDLTTSPTTVKAIAIRDEHSSTVETQTYQIQLPAPVISISNTGLATITTEAGSTIHYTTDGSTPTASSPSYSSSVQLTNPQTIRAIATRTNYDDSEVASGEYVSAGVSSGKVILDDREDHSWSYYSDNTLPQMMRSLNPADVKIIYHGNGANTVSTSDAASPAADSWKASTFVSSNPTVQVSSTEADSVFIYLKTLERTDGSSSLNPEGRCAYRVIPNPFSKRPVYGSDASAKWRGFYKWRIKKIKNGKIYTAASGGTEKTAYSSGNYDEANCLDADEIYYFAPTNEYGMEVELEALWARAYVTTGYNDMGTYVTGTNAYERNFHVVTSTGQTASYYQKTYPVTISSRYPDGTNGGGSFTAGSFEAGADTKIENIAIGTGTNNTWTGKGYNFVVGRGVTGTVNIIRAISATATNTFSFRVESGTYNNLYFMGSSGVTTGHETAIMGCDYDRASNSNSNLKVNTDILMSNGGTAGSTGTIGEERIHCTVKSGNYDLGSYGGNVQFYMSSPGTNNYALRTLVIEGGIFSDVSGGMESNATNVGDHLMFNLRIKGGTINGATYGAAQNAAGGGHRKFIITGGDFKGWIAGGANGTNTTGGKLSGKTYIYFGGNATCDSNGSTTTIGPGQATGGNIFGAGSGNANAGTNATVGEVDQSTVVIADNSVVEHNVYGGGNYGYVVGTGTTNKSDMYILGGTVNGSVFGGSNMQKGNIVNYFVKGGVVKGGVYGGSNSRGNLSGSVTMNISGGTIEQGVYGGGYGTNSNSCDVSGTVNITMTGGTVLKGLYGGGNVNSKVSGITTVSVNGGTIGASNARANVHGGGLGSLTRILNSVVVNIGAQGATSGATIYGDVYGGSAEGKTNGNTARENDATTAVTLNAGTLNGSMYGGGLGTLNDNAADVYGPVTVVVNGGSVVDPDGPNGSNPGSIFGCNNVYGSPKNTVQVTVNSTDSTVITGEGENRVKTYAINGVYGGGNQAHYDYDNSNYPIVLINGCESTSIKDVYGGGNAAAVPSTHVTINGGDIYRVFGGGNGESGTPAHVGYKNKDDGSTESPYNNADGNVSVQINGGTIYQVFGGSNAHGLIKGTKMSVSVEKNSSCPIQISALYGGGNKAASKVGSITIGCMDNNDMIDSLFCGANQAAVTGDINFTMTKGRIKNLFGGNNVAQAPSGSITVTVEWATGQGACTTNHLENVFGGGNLATFGTAGSPKAPTVKILNGTVSGNVYGGGKGDPSDHSKGQVTGNPIVTIGDLTSGHESYVATVTGDVYGGGDAGDVVGTPTVTVVNKCNTSVGYVYGGGNAADVSATNVIINGGTITHDVFGGGHGDKASLNVNGETGHTDKVANVNGNASVTITGGKIDRVFAGSNINGSITGTNNVLSISKSASAACDMIIREVYGGGNMAAGNATSISIGCTGDLVSDANGQAANPGNIGTTLEGIGTVYGGANQANIGSSETASNITVNITSGIVANVYGGNNDSGDIYGTITVNINKNDNAACSGSWYVGNVFGGGNQAVYTAPSATQQDANAHNYPAVNILNGAVSGDVFGGGFGNANDDTKGVVNGNPQVTINGSGASVAGGIYGGGSLAPTVGNPVVTLTTGAATNIFGGGKAARVTGAPTVNVNGGTVSTGVYGGCNTSGTVSGNIAVNLTAGTIGAQNGTTDIVFGGGYGDQTATQGNVTVTINGSTIHGNVYGGSALGQVNNESSDQTTIHVLSGTVNGNIYGGGLGETGSSDEAKAKGQVNGTVTVNIGATDGAQSPTYSGSATINGSVYGCNNTNGSPKADVTVNIYKTETSGKSLASYTQNDATYAIDQVFGGGNQADYSPTLTSSRATVHIYTCANTIRRVFGGGNAAAAYGVVTTIDGGRFDYIFGGGNGENNHAANIGAGGTNLTVNSGVINYLFGGSNETGTINGQMRVAVNNTGGNDCTERIKNFFAGGNLANIGAPGQGNSVDLNTTIACGTVFDAVYGGSNLADIYGNVTLTINGGTIGEVYAGSKGVAAGDATYTNGKAANIYGNTILNINGGDIGNAFGGSNINGNITGSITVDMDWSLAPNGCNNATDLHIDTIFGASNLATYTPTNANGNSPAVNIKHGTVSGSVFGAGNGDPKDATKGVVTSNPVVTIGDANANHYAIVGGNVYGGGNNAAVSGSTTVTYNDSHASSTVAKLFGGGNAANVSGTTSVTLTNGKVTGGVYGGCNDQGSVGAVTIALNGGQVGATGAGNEADVYGGGYGANTTTTGNIGVTLNGTTVYGDIYGGSALGGVNASTSNTSTVTLTSATLYGSVFGGGKGDNSTTAISNGNTIVNINVANTNLTGIYGGANIRGNVKGATAVNINANVGAVGDSLNIFGGGYGSATNTEGNVTVTVGDLAGNVTPVIYGDIYGGSALGNVNNEATDVTTVNFYNGTLHGNLYGGGLGDASNAAKVNGKVVVNISSTSQDSVNCKIDLRKATIYGCNNTNGSPQTDVEVHVYKTAFNYSDYASGNNYTAASGADPYYAIDQVFGGGNQADYAPENGNANSTKKAKVYIHGCTNTIRRVFGGGNAAAAVGLQTIIDGGRFDYVFGGGNGETDPANIGLGGTDLQIHGGKIRTLFGGSNTSGTITGEMGVSIDNVGDCNQDMYIAEFFCGNNLAPINTNITATIGCGTTFGDVYGGCNLANISGNVELTIEGGTMNNVYGGSKGSAGQAANISGNVHLIITGGSIGNAYGGSNINGNITGSITVDVEKEADPCLWNIGNVYGASNLAPYTPTTAGSYPVVNIKNGTINGSVYGGGKGAPAIVTSNPVVTIGVDTNAVYTAIVIGNVYGGGYAAEVSGNTTVTYNDNNSNSYVAKLFGGGNAADVSGSTTVTLTNGKVTGGVYGGCNSTGSVGAVTVALNGGQVGATGAGNEADVYGGGYGSATTTTGNIGVTLNGTTVYGDIYGGSALGGVNTNTDNTSTITLSTATLHGSVFGGGKGDANTTAVSNGNATVIINANDNTNRYLTGIYGGANIRGNVKGAINVNINANVGAVGDSLDIFGGGYGAATGTEGNVTVTIGTLDASKNPTIYGDIYGGSALGNVNSDANDLTKVDFLNGTLHGNLYGGGLGDKASLGADHNDVAAKVYGQVQVNIGADGQSTCVINLSDASIFGCNNTNGSPQDNVTVNIYCTGHDAKNVATYTENDATYAINQVFGGGNQADYAPENGNANSTKKAKVEVYGCTNTIGRLFGGGNAAAAVGLQTIINGGRFNYVFGGGNGEDRAANIGLGGTDLQIHGGRINNLFGGSNTSGTITGPMLVDIDGEGGCGDMFIAEFFCGNNLADIESDITATIGCGTTFGDVYGGCNLADITGNVNLTIEGGTIGRVFGGSKGRIADNSNPQKPIEAKAANIDGNVTLNIEGGTIGSAFGGSNINGNITGSIEVNIEKDANPACGWSLGNVYGASNDATYTPSKPGSTLTVNVKNGTVTGNVYGGGKGATATVTSNPVVIVGDLTDGHNSYAAVVTGDVYGGGDAAGVTGNTSVTIQKANTTVGNAYGGGNAAAITGTTLLTMTDGAAGNLYGGGRAAGVSSTATVYMNGGAVSTGIYGGCNASGTISGAVAVYVNGGTVGTDATHTANVHGGGYGSSTLTSSNVTVIIGNEASTQPVIWGDVYGGSALGNVNTSTSDLTKVWLKKGTINGSLYGGGLGDAQNPALVNGAVQVVVDGGEVKTTSNTTRTTGAVFGCNNVNGTPKGAVEVIINSTVASTGSGENKVYALQGVYGGGNLAHFDPTTPGNYPTVTINGCGTSIKDVFGGGNAAAVPYTYVTINGGDINRVFAGGNGESGTPANVGYKSTAIENSYGAGTANVLITDGSIHQVFGGSNANGTIREGGNINVERGATDCGLHIDEIYGGGNLANGNAGTISIGCTGAQGEGIGDVYGGANQANVGNNILLNITGGSIDRVFGGNNTSGTISGTITVNIEWDNSNCYKYLGSVFGGGNLASYTGSPVVNINNGTVTNNVYGGGKGSSAVVTGNPVVTVGDLTNGHSSYVAVVTGDVYGGGDAAAVTGNTSVTIQKANTNVGSAYGGGNAAAISGTTLLTMTDGTAGNLYGGGNAAGVGSTATVNLNGGTVTTGIYGGCNSTGTITGAVAVNINGGTVGSSSAPANIHGGGYGAATGTSGNVEVIIGTAVGAQTYPTIYGDVYGGSALGKVNGTSVNTSLHTYVTMNAGTINGSLYGGALGNSTTVANVYAPVAVNVNGGRITGEVYGCNNVNGAPQSTVTVDINGTATVQSGYALGKVFGGGNRAAYTGTPVVTVHNCDNSIEYVYGGGNAASVAGTDVTIYGGDEIGNVFGGCYGADVTTSGTLVKIYGGKIGKVFGGSNSSGTITGAISVTVNKATETGHSSCDIDIDEIYGGGNMAASSAGTLNIGCADHIGSVYGGSNDADITGDIVLNITSGHIDNVFGGNNTGHGISGSITVNIEDAENTCGMEIGNVYGGGNMAAYSNSGQNYPVVNIKKGSITGNVFGGGLGSTATVTANPQVVLTGGTIAGKVFGGGEAAPVVGNPTITASGAEATATRLYGGGLGSTAVVTGNTTVIVSNGEFGYVFGGGEAADQSGNVTVNILGGTITEDVYGGGALAHTNIGNISGNTITPAVYTTTVNLTGGTMKNVYGGGLGDADTEAKVYGNVLVKLNEGVADDQPGAAVTGYLFGCNNINGTPKGSATVHVFATQNSGLGSILTKNNSSYDMKAVYGGGNMAAYIPASDTASTHVIIDGCGKTSIEYVYGGGNAAPAPATDVKVYGTYKVSSIFGGGNGKDSITVNGVKQANPGADVGIYKVSETVYNATDPRLRYYDPGHEKGDDKYILYGDTTRTIIGTTNVTFYGGIVSHLFGGSNTKGDIIKKANVILGDENLMTCEFSIDDVYGGSNEAYMSGSSGIDMKCIDGMGEVYGGSRMADVSQDVVLTISGGHYDKVFGGNNISGRIFGSITVNIEQTGCLPIVIGELYGGGNQAPYSVFGYDGNTVLEQGTRLYHDPVINIISCDSIHKVFGGGLGATAKVVGNPTININMVKGWTNGDYRGGSDTQNDPHAAYINTKKVSDNIGVIDTVFGGGNEAIVVGETYVNVGTESTVTVRDVTKAVYDVISSQIDGIEDPGFAQGDGDAVTKDLTITVEGANITGNIYGGGNNANVTGGTHVQLGPGQ